MFKQQVEKLLNAYLEENPSIFLLDFTVSSSNAIKVVLDGDNGVSLKDCMAASRSIEHNLDREDVDFALEVTSAGATEPLRLPRQFVKNIGRKLEVRTKAGVQIQANLIAANQQGVHLEWKAREPKPIGKGKVTVVKTLDLDYSDIAEAKVMIIF